MVPDVPAVIFPCLLIPVLPRIRGCLKIRNPLLSGNRHDDERKASENRPRIRLGRSGIDERIFQTEIEADYVRFVSEKYRILSIGQFDNVLLSRSGVLDDHQVIRNHIKGCRPNNSDGILCLLELIEQAFVIFPIYVLVEIHEGDEQRNGEDEGEKNYGRKEQEQYDSNNDFIQEVVVDVVFLAFETKNRRGSESFRDEIGSRLKNYGSVRKVGRARKIPDIFGANLRIHWSELRD